MRAQFRLSDLIPTELSVVSVQDAAEAIVVAASGRKNTDVHDVELHPVVFIVVILG
jgi:hypothetical protein